MAQSAERRAKKQNSKNKIQIAGRRAQSEKTNLKKQNSKIYHRDTENTENKSQNTKFK